jgi:membrane-associated phospholipid phosphatase
MEQLYELSLALTIWLQDNLPQLAWLMTLITAMGEEVFYLAVLPAVYWSVDKRLGRQLGYIFLLSGAVNNISKNLFRQPRPFWIDPDVGMRETDGYGMPSGHAQHATAVYLLLAAWLRRGWGWPAALLFIFLMSLSRVYLGVHFVQDVVVGFVFGLLLVVLFLFWQRVYAERFGRYILGRRLLIMFLVPLMLVIAYVAALLLLGPPNMDVPWAEFVPAAEVAAHEDATSSIAGLFGFGIGMILESSRIRFRADGPGWKRVARYVLGIVVALGIWGLRAVLPAEPEWVALPLRFLRYLLLLLWVTYFAPWLFVRLRLAEADEESEVRVSL